MSTTGVHQASQGAGHPAFSGTSLLGAKQGWASPGAAGQEEVRAAPWRRHCLSVGRQALRRGRRWQIIREARAEC